MDEIKLRSMQMSDAEMIFNWRNAHETRKYFFNPQPLKLEDHIHWVKHSLQMPNRCLLIAEISKEPIGVLRYDIIDMCAEIDIYIKPALVGKGLGSRLLEIGSQWIKHLFPNVIILQAKIIPDNKASIRAFEKAGFNIKMQVYEKIIR